MKLEVNFQISEHELKPVFMGSYTSKVSENSRYYASAFGVHFFLRHMQNVGKDPEQNLVGCFDELKINSRSLHCFKRKDLLSVS